MSEYIKVKPTLSMRFDPAPWNDPAVIEKRNCMTYALNAPNAGWVWKNIAPVREGMSPDESFERASRQRAHMSERFISYAVKGVSYLTAKEMEGLQLRIQGFKGVLKSDLDPSTQHVIGVDAVGEHVYRLDGNGTWSHKNAHLPATDRDYSDDVITDLDRANLGGARAVDYFRRCEIEKLMKEKQDNVYRISQIFKKARDENGTLSLTDVDRAEIKGLAEAARVMRIKIIDFANTSPVPHGYVRVPEQGLWVQCPS